MTRQVSYMHLAAMHVLIPGDGAGGEGADGAPAGSCELSYLLPYPQKCCQSDLAGGSPGAGAGER